MNINKMKNFVQAYWEFLLISIGLSLLVVNSLNHIFFWDTVQLGAKHATFFYENDLAISFLPNNIDSGHIPTFGYLLAVLWTVFGKSLWISHLFILPFALGIAWQLQLLVLRFFQRKYLIWVLIIIFLDTTLLSQISLVSPDVPLLFFFLLAINSLAKRSKWRIAFAFSCLFLISLRGMILTVPLFLFEVIWFWNKQENAKNRLIQLIKIGIPYLPAAFIFLVFSYYHFLQKGWIGYHENSPWAVFFEKVSFQGLIKNTFIFGWRIIDFGRLFVWLVGLITIVIVGVPQLRKSTQFKQLLLLFGLIIGFLAIPAMIYTDLKGHRYFMPVYITFSLLVLFVLLELNNSTRWKRAGVSILILGLISGSFWVYPKSVAQGWDSTLAHLPYYSLRQSMVNYMNKNKMDKESIGFDFPGAYSQKYLDLSENTWSFPEVDFGKQEYILYSNVVNEFTDNELTELETKWEVVHVESYSTVQFILYRKKQE